VNYLVALHKLDQIEGKIPEDGLYRVGFSVSLNEMSQSGKGSAFRRKKVPLDKVEAPDGGTPKPSGKGAGPGGGKADAGSAEETWQAVRIELGAKGGVDVKVGVPGFGEVNAHIEIEPKVTLEKK
jgi:hypothetical protein